MRAFGALHDLARVDAQHLVVEGAAEKKKAAFRAPRLHRRRDRRLDVDLGQHFDIIGIGDQEIARRPHAAMRRIERRARRVGRALVAWRALGVIGLRPDVAADAGARDPLDFDEVAPSGFAQRGREGVVVPGVRRSARAAGARESRSNGGGGGAAAAKMSVMKACSVLR